MENLLKESTFVNMENNGLFPKKAMEREYGSRDK